VPAGWPVYKESGEGGGRDKQHFCQPGTSEGSSSMSSAESRGSDDEDVRVDVLDEGKSTSRSETFLSSGLDVDGFDEGACIEALLGWLNNDGEQETCCPIAQEFDAALTSAATGLVNITMCSADELTAMRSPWGDRASRVEAVAAWCVDDGVFSWKFENWREELRNLDGQEENLLICSTFAPSDVRCGRDLAEGRSGGNSQACSKKFLLVCRFSMVNEVAADGNSNEDVSQERYYVISCPPSVLPLRFAAIVPTSGELPWRLEHRQVLPLPG